MAYLHRVKKNIVLGRAFLSAMDANELKATNGSQVLSLGEGIGSIKVKISKVPKKINKRIGTPSLDGTLLRVEQWWKQDGSEAQQ